MQFWGDFLENFFGFLPIFGVIFTQKNCFYSVIIFSPWFVTEKSDFVCF